MNKIIERLNGKKIRVNKNSITIYNDDFTTAGVISGVTAFKDMQPREKFALKDKGLRNLMQYAAGLYSVRGNVIYINNTVLTDNGAEQLARLELGAENCAKCFIANTNIYA